MIMGFDGFAVSFFMWKLSLYANVVGTNFENLICFDFGFSSCVLICVFIWNCRMRIVIVIQFLGFFLLLFSSSGFWCWRMYEVGDEDEEEG